MSAPWYLGRLAAFDLETTDKDPQEARIVEAYIGEVGGGLPPVDRTPLLVDPGVEVPAEATKIHGHTTEYVREHGVEAAHGVNVVATAVAGVLAAGVPLVGHNISYDLTVLERESARYGLPPLAERVGGEVRPVIDTYVLSKHLDRRRRRVSEEQGAHTLKTCAQTFGFRWVDKEAHGARYDALMAARIAWRMGVVAHWPLKQRPRLSSRSDERHLFDDLATDPLTLHAHQQRWAAEQAADYQRWLRSPKAREKQDPDAVVSGAWPIQAAPALTP